MRHYGYDNTPYPWHTLKGKTIRPPITGEHKDDYMEYLRRWAIMNKQDAKFTFNGMLLKVEYTDELIEGL